jgi:hypothetical protein
MPGSPEANPTVLGYVLASRGKGPIPPSYPLLILWMFSLFYGREEMIHVNMHDDS